MRISWYALWMGVLIGAVVNAWHMSGILNTTLPDRIDHCVQFQLVDNAFDEAYNYLDNTSLIDEAVGDQVEAFLKNLLAPKEKTLLHAVVLHLLPKLDKIIAPTALKAAELLAPVRAKVKSTTHEVEKVTNTVLQAIRGGGLGNALAASFSLLLLLIHIVCVAYLHGYDQTTWLKANGWVSVASTLRTLIAVLSTVNIVLGIVVALFERYALNKIGLVYPFIRCSLGDMGLYQPGVTVGWTSGITILMVFGEIWLWSVWLRQGRHRDSMELTPLPAR